MIDTSSPVLKDVIYFVLTKKDNFYTTTINIKEYQNFIVRQKIQKMLNKD